MLGGGVQRRMRNRHFRKHKDLIRHACKNAIKRNDNGEPSSWMQNRSIVPEPSEEKLDFLERCRLKLRRNSH